MEYNFLAKCILKSNFLILLCELCDITNKPIIRNIDSIDFLIKSCHLTNFSLESFNGVARISDFQKFVSIYKTEKELTVTSVRQIFTC